MFSPPVRIPKEGDAPRSDVRKVRRVPDVDPLEQEAESVAADLTRGATHDPMISSGPPRISRLGTAPGTGVSPDNRTHDLVRGPLSRPGRPLDAATRAYFEPRFRRDFGDVRIHSDGEAAESARALGARAYTIGNEVAFARGNFAPATADGRRLLGHELAHVVQQSGAASALQCAPETDEEEEEEPVKVGPVEFPSSRYDVPYGDVAGKFLTYYDRWRENEAKVEEQEAERREAERHDNAVLLLTRLKEHPAEKKVILDLLAYSGLLQVVRHFGCAPPTRSTKTLAYLECVKDALFRYDVEWRKTHLISDVTMGPLTNRTVEAIQKQAKREEFEFWWNEGYSSVRGSASGAVAAGVWSQFTDDPRKIAGAAGATHSLSVAGGAVALGIGNQGSYVPEVVNKPVAPLKAPAVAATGEKVGDIVNAGPAGILRVKAIMPNGEPLLETVVPAARPGRTLPAAGETSVPESPSPISMSLKPTKPALKPMAPKVLAPPKSLSEPSAQKPEVTPAPPKVLLPPKDVSEKPVPQGQRRLVTQPPIAPRVQVTVVPRQEVAALIPRLDALANKEVIVGVQARMTVGSAQALKRLEANEFRAFPESRGVGQTPYAILPPVSNPPGTPAREGFDQPESGYVVKPGKESRSVEVLAYNTSDPQRGSNVSHAEAQVVNYLEIQPEALLRHVERVEFVVIGREVCAHCVRWIQGLYSHLAAIRKNHGLPPPTIVVRVSPENIVR